MVLATALSPTQAAITIRKPACPSVFIACHLIGTTVDAAVRVGRAICQILIGQVQMKKLYAEKAWIVYWRRALVAFVPLFCCGFFKSLKAPGLE